MDLNYNIIIRKKDKGLQYIISYKDKTGKWKQKSKQGFEDSREGKQLCKKAADEAVKKLKESAELDLNTEHEGITFKEFVDMYIEHEKLYKEGNTIHGYIVASKSFKTLYDIELKKINSLNIQSCIDELIKNKLSPYTIDGYINKLKTFFNAAVKNYKILSESPMKNIVLPKIKKEPTKTALTKAELEVLLSKLKNKKYYIISLIAGKCGLRIGEILGLTWNDIDEGKMLINIDKQWKLLETPKNKYGFGELKNPNAYRKVPVPPIVLSELTKFKNAHPININGRILDYTSNDNLSRHLSETYSKVGFDISVHELRHTYTTLLISNGVDFKTAAKLLGHDVEQTLKTYSHVTSDMLYNASKIINNIF